MAKFSRRRRPFRKKTPSESAEGLPFSDSDLQLAPSSFVHISQDCYRFTESSKPIRLEKKYLLASLAALNDEQEFAQAALGWSEKGLFASIFVDQPVEKLLFPEITQGDSVELFIDTRDIKTSGFNTRFCHHFFFLPKEVEGHRAGELTRFRTEDAHEWCDPKELAVVCHFGSSSYELNLFIPEHCLYGYNPSEINRLGFTYRINRWMGSPQHFSVSSSDYPIEEQPSLWASLRLLG